MRILRMIIETLFKNNPEMSRVESVNQLEVMGL